MIGRLQGTVVRCTPGRVLLDVHGVGYDVQIPLSTFYAIDGAGPDRATETVSLHVHTHVREDTLALYGFSTESERESFVRLIGISGVGPRMALAILSGIGVDDLRSAVLASDRERLTKIPGIGRKTAERVLLELKDKLSRTDGASAPGQAPDAAPGEGATLADDAISALVNLGYAREVARKAVTRAVGAEGEAASLETVLRRSLAGLVR